MSAHTFPALDTNNEFTGTNKFDNGINVAAGALQVAGSNIAAANLADGKSGAGKIGMQGANNLGTNSGGALVFDASLGNLQTVTLGANTGTPTLVNTSPGQIVTFLITQDSTGGRTFTWPTNVFGGGAVDITAGAWSIQDLICDSSGNAYPKDNLKTQFNTMNYYQLWDFVNNYDGQTGTSVGTPSGGYSEVQTLPDKNHPGVWVLLTGTSINTGYSWVSAAQENFTQILSSSSGIPWTCEFLLETNSISNIRIQVGFIYLSGANPPTYGDYFQFDSSVDAYWHYITNQNSSLTNAASSVAVVANTWYRLRISFNGNSISPVVSFYINGVLVGTSSTNLSTNGYFSFQATNLSTVAQSVYLDLAALGANVVR
jgi:hypothetical protein